MPSVFKYKKIACIRTMERYRADSEAYIVKLVFAWVYIPIKCDTCSEITRTDSHYWVPEEKNV